LYRADEIISSVRVIRAMLSIALRRRNICRIDAMSYDRVSL